MTIVHLSIEKLRKEYDEAMAETNRLMIKWDIFERNKHPEYLAARAKENEILTKITKEWERITR